MNLILNQPSRDHVLVAEVDAGSGRELHRVLSDPAVSVLVVEHRDRLARFGVEHLQAASGRRMVVLDSGEAAE